MSSPTISANFLPTQSQNGCQFDLEWLKQIESITPMMAPTVALLEDRLAHLENHLHIGAKDYEYPTKSKSTVTDRLGKLEISFASLLSSTTSQVRELLHLRIGSWDPERMLLLIEIRHADT